MPGRRRCSTGLHRFWPRQLTLTPQLSQHHRELLAASVAAWLLSASLHSAQEAHHEISVE